MRFNHYATFCFDFAGMGVHIGTTILIAFSHGAMRPSVGSV
jgi:hypothetical protein